ncbi:hypothetical protein N7523_009033 [Penicillium sp. IBT 18751x]|nr:hypothetical protein N7523_009033 [Penicillium sp. IBT 18751x]
MKSAGLLSLTFLLSAVPAFAQWGNPQTVTIKLANDHTGAWANEAIPADGKSYPVNAFWASSALSQNGGVSATSAELNAYGQNAHCNIQCPRGTLALNAQTTYVSFEYGKVVNLNDATVSCQATHW